MCLLTVQNFFRSYQLSFEFFNFPCGLSTAREATTLAESQCG